jgi:hypothetical protein
MHLKTITAATIKPETCCLLRKSLKNYQTASKSINIQWVQVSLSQNQRLCIHNDSSFHQSNKKTTKVKETHHFHYCASTIISSTLNLKQSHTLQSSVTTHSDKQNTTFSMNNIPTTKCLPLTNTPHKKTVSKKKKKNQPQSFPLHSIRFQEWAKLSVPHLGRRMLPCVLYLHLLASQHSLLAVDSTLHSIERHTC